MITIEYLQEPIAGEPAPNFYWRGYKSDFLRLSNDLHLLGESNGSTVILNDLNYISSNLKIQASSIKSGNILNEKKIM